jgi:hypothetical protein
MLLPSTDHYATHAKNDEARMSNDEGMTDAGEYATILFRHSNFDIISLFVI